MSSIAGTAPKGGDCPPIGCSTSATAPDDATANPAKEAPFFKNRLRPAPFAVRFGSMPFLLLSRRVFVPLATFSAIAG
jgi:hypothetical protein